jgi:uncharacterized protein DUF1127
MRKKRVMTEKAPNPFGGELVKLSAEREKVMRFQSIAGISSIIRRRWFRVSSAKVPLNPRGHTDRATLTRMKNRDLEDVGITRSDIYRFKPNRIQRPFV